MVRSMIAGVSGLRTHQSKLDVIGNNIANVNTWGFRSSSFNFMDSMYANTTNSSAGDDLAGGAGGRNASQVGYGVTTGSIMSSFVTGAPAPSAENLDCMIDGTGFFLVGNMINGQFQDVASSGLNLSRIGIFRVDGNGYLVDAQRSYVYGYAVVDGTGIPEKPATQSVYTVAGAGAEFVKNNGAANTITIAGKTYDTTATDYKAAVQDWIKQATQAGEFLENYKIDLTNYDEAKTTVDFKITRKKAEDTGAGGTNTDQEILGAAWQGNAADAPEVNQTVAGSYRVPGVAAEYSDELSVIQIPTDPNTGERYEIQSYKINEDGTILGVDNDGRSIAIGQVALVTVENPNGLEKTEGYYYQIGANAGQTNAIKPNGGPAGRIRGNYLEMANVDLANEFSQMITTQRGYQANSKIITVTDQMLEELVNMKR